MTQAEWMDASEKMEAPMRELMGIVRKLNISEPVTIAVNKDGMSWLQTHEAGHRYDTDVYPVEGISVHCDGDCYFSKK